MNKQQVVWHPSSISCEQRNIGLLRKQGMVPRAAQASATQTVRA